MWNIGVVLKGFEHPLDLILLEVCIGFLLNAFLKPVDEENFSFSLLRLVGVSDEHHGLHRGVVE